ncbi:hypothetical protein KAFR_0G02190 [Kazachstania africana CBS 2517]|uniref:GIY-YIG domain-containing protein n=1 Tax=Kazachstania africana (strain ATCC 22294 / BCRC 22015 / CBS 2517 / CECT 1963 / NBRC 1671 / NRRL Y-8276) TaxID=1071382 RepID=H2AY03_KAZAF|nr:hypothetical protein KAFR_0G02190 [Kazachstania africana CBS 2517]CCF59253.1 hypothetical protein KAFR_0G02190 [Kazachstania africana CBS 2517]
MTDFSSFYCCYLLQSINKRQSFYIGSTPNPARRLRQHNGDLTNGGAYRTKKLGARPWEMVAIVYGFPNNIAALQFEHAWQHGYKTRFISTDDRVVKNKNGGRSPHHKLANVKLLLKHSFFKFMNLKIHFYSNVVKEIWDCNKFHIESIDCETDKLTCSQPILSKNDFKDLSVDAMLEYADKHQSLIQEHYNSFIQQDEDYLERYEEMLKFGEMSCFICHDKFDYTSDDKLLKPFIALCTNEMCKSICHLSCLYNFFLDQETEKDGRLHLIPTSGKCPNCSTVLPWTIVVKYSSLLNSLYS